MAGELLGRSKIQLVIEDADCKGGLAIMLTQTRMSNLLLTSRYRIAVRAKTDDGEFLVGTFSTCPPGDATPQSRVVAMASCPGALTWTLLVDAWEDPDFPGLGVFGDLSGSIYAAAGEPGGQMPGVVRVGERRKYYSGTAPGTVNILAGERVTSWSAFAAGAGATVTIGGGSAIPLPTGGGVAGNGSGITDGPIAVVFAATAGYLIEVAESA